MSQRSATEPDTDHQPPADDAKHRIAVRTAAVAGIFSLVVCALLLYDYSLRRAKDPHEAALFKDLKAMLAEQPDNERLRESIRRLDLQLREDYSRRRALANTGAWLLLAGIAVFLIAAKSAATLRRRLPAPQPQSAPRDAEARWTAAARLSVAALAVGLAAVAVGLSMTSRARLPEGAKELAARLDSNPGERETKPEVPAAPLPSPETYQRMWPRFRGPSGSGISAYENIPTSWDDASGEGILWKTPVPLPGLNSPVVWADRVFLSGATKDRREVYCFDTETGKVLWQQDVPPHPQAAQTREPEYAGYAAPTVATDGRFVMAVFADGQLAAFDFRGQMAWHKSLGVPENAYGHASSLATYRGLVLVQMDQGTRRKPNSKLYAFRAATGEKAWEVARPVAVSWTSPIVITHDGRDQLVTCSDPWVIAYDPADGTELWRANCISGESGPSPVFASGTVYVGNEYCQLSAIRADGVGEVTKTHVLWTGEDGLPDVCSPLATDQYVFLLGAGALTCYDAKQGTMLWEEYEAFDYARFTSSPSLVGNRIYLFGEIEEQDGKGEWVEKCSAWVVEPADAAADDGAGPMEGQGCKVISRSNLGEGCATSPAFQDGRIYIRGKKHLFCIAAP